MHKFHCNNLNQEFLEGLGFRLRGGEWVAFKDMTLNKVDIIVATIINSKTGDGVICAFDHKHPGVEFGKLPSMAAEDNMQKLISDYKEAGLIESQEDDVV